MRAAVFGATRGIGRALVRRMATRGDSVCLLGRDADALSASVADLRARAPGAQASAAQADLDAPEAFDEALAAARRQLGGLDTVVLCAGAFGTQPDLERSPERAGEVMRRNFEAAVHFCEAARRTLLPGGGTLGVFTSVAGVRGRASVAIYGASKAGLSAYLEGLDAGYRCQGLRVVDIRPGFVRTDMTAGLPEPPFAAEAEAAARHALAALDSGKPVAYVPPVWRFVMAGVRAFPRAAMRRLRF